MAEPTCWLIRAGENSRHARRFVDHNVVALGWPDIAGLGDLRGVTRSVIRELLAAASHVAVPDQDAAELLAFRDDVRVGDLVITPDGQTREILVGEVTGEYEYLDPSPAADYKHVREVRWYGRLERDLVPGDLEKETRWRRTIRRLGNQAQWRIIAARVRDGAGRSPSARGRPDKPGARRDRQSPTRRPGRRCPACGLVKAEAQYTEGDDRCVDCR